MPSRFPDPLDPVVRRRAVERARRSVHPAVLDSLVVSTAAQARNRAALAEGVAVVTGQQAGLFGGPLYTVHKIVAAIVNARRLAEETGVPCAPVFWLQDEDHDFEEIRSAHLLTDAGQTATLSLEDDASLVDRPVVYRTLTDGVQAILRQAAHHLDDLPHAEAVLEVLAASHTPGRSVTSAFREGIDHLFASHGVLVVDPMHAALREAAAPVHRRAIEEADVLAALLDAEPIHVRPGAPLSFIHPDGETGRRVRVEPCDDGFIVVGSGRRLSRAEVLAAPHTTSALLRPIVQDTLLPTAALVGGPGELRYLAQVVPLWGHFGLPVPLVVHRSRFVLVDGGTRRNLDRLGLTVADLERSRDDLLVQLGSDDPTIDTAALQAALTTSARTALDALDVSDMSTGTQKAVDKTQASIEHAAARLVRRIRRELATTDTTRTSRLDKVLAWLRPHGVPQERVHAWPSFAARMGSEALVQRLLDAAEPFDGTLIEVDL